MKKMLLFAVLLSGCATSVPIWYKANTPPSRSLHSATDCEIHGVQSVPASNHVRTTSTFQTPTHVRCNPVTNSCTASGGDTIGGQTYTVDVNADLRAKVVRQCMAKRGWQLVTLPTCGVPQHTAYNEAPDKYRAPKGITAESCAILDRARNEWVIFTPV